jgi:NADP-dependent 3-hydroxy acid dehydrogenase YdfG
VTGDEKVDPFNAALAGAMLVIPREYPGIGCRSIDIGYPANGSTGRDRLIRQLLNEIRASGGSTPVALRGFYRWVRHYEPVLPVAGTGTGFKPGGAYLVIGGLGRLGMALAEQMAGAGFKRLILTGKSGLPPREEWNSHSNPTYPSLLRLENQGAELLVMEADIADEEGLNRLFEAAEKRFGKVDGVIHAAGPMDKDAFPSIWSLTPRLVEGHFQARAEGPAILEKVMDLRGMQPDFCITMSSLSSILGGLGCAAYTASHAMMEAFARRRTLRWFNIAWDGWQTQRIHRDEEGNPLYLTGKEAAKLHVSRAEGFDLVRRVLSLDDERQVAVSRAPLQDRVNAFVHVQPAQDPPQSGGAVDPAQFQGNRLEQFIAETWKEILKLQTLDPGHNLFDLGAVSRDMVRANWLLNLRLKRHIPLDLMFRYPSVAELAKYLTSEGRVETVSQDKLADASRRMTTTFQRLKEKKHVN